MFAGADNNVEIRSPIDDVQVVSRSNLRKHIQTIAHAEDNAQYAPTIDVQGLVQHLANVAVPNPYIPNPLSKDEMASLRKGIYCANCGSFDVEIARQYVTCPCGLHEPRDEAIIRTICEYGVLNYHKDMGRRELLEFFGGDISLDVLRNTADKYFSVFYKHRRSWYQNLRNSFDKLTYLFNIKLPKIWYINESEYLVIKTKNKD